MLLARAFALLAFTAAAATWAHAFDCVEKHCPQMQSCAEAYHHLTVCGEAKRDADNDGIPCENVCGKTPEEFRRRLGKVPETLAPLLSQPAQPDLSPSDESPVGDTTPSTTGDAPAAFSCAGKRRCADVDSCEEARFYLTTCGIRSLDRNGDGTPCESLCGGR